jgi:transcription initiation factor TFIID TATA-box-binding protein
MNPIHVRIENVVASTSLGTELDLGKIAIDLDGAEYEPTRFPGLIYRLREPRTAILLFHSGKVVCTGGKSLKQVEESIRLVSAKVRKAGQKVVATPKIDIQNIVATSDLGGELDLNVIALTLGLDRVEYEPEQFPGLVYRLEDPRVVMLLFGSGKLVCTGARRPSDLGRAVERVRDELRSAGLLSQDRRPARVETPKPPARPAFAAARPSVVPPAAA